MMIVLRGFTNMWMRKPKKNQTARWVNIKREVLAQWASSLCFRSLVSGMGCISSQSTGRQVTGIE
jgi:hypothetical protein